MGESYVAPTVSIPDVGNQPRPAAKMMISGMPITKYGIEYRTRLAPLPSRSVRPPRFHPAFAPIHRPTMIEMSSPKPMSRIVGQNRSPMTSVTGLPRKKNE